jgi:hypothetical protein
MWSQTIVSPILQAIQMVIIKQEGISIPSTLHSTLPNTQNLIHMEWGHQLHTTHLQVNMMFHLLPEGLDCLVIALEEISSVEFGWACHLKNHKY